MVHSLSREGLVGDVGKDFDQIHSSLSFARANKTLGMVNIGRGELKRAPSRRFRKVRAMLRAKPRDGSNTIASRSCNSFSRMASIKQRQDVVLASR